MSDFEIEINASLISERISKYLRSFEAGDPRFKEAALRVSQLIVGRAKVNIRKKGLIDTERLINSIVSKVTIQGESITEITVGSEKVPYARVLEEGFKRSIAVSAHSRFHEHLWSQPIVPYIVSVRGYNRKLRIKKRPYLRPAIRNNLTKITAIFRELAKSGR